jgi:O-antigen/teichoic acid export membrane protein
VNIVPNFVRRRLAHRPNLLKIVDNIGWLLMDKILRMGVGLLLGVWIARYLGPEQFGQINFATAFVGLFGAIAGLGLQSIVIRDIVNDPDNAKLTLGTAGVLHTIGGLLAFVLALGFIAYLRPDDVIARSIVAILGSAMLFKFSDVAVYWFESQVQSKYIVLVQNCAFLIFAVVKVGLILNMSSLTAFVWTIMAEALLVAILMLLTLGIHGQMLRQFRFTLKRAKELLTDSWPLLLSGFAIMIYMKIDQIMLGQLIGDEAVGVYSAAVRISEVWYFIPMMILTSVFPSILEAKKKSEVLFYQRLQSLFDLMTLISIPVAIAMTVLSSFVIEALYGNAYHDAAIVLAIHIWASVFVFLGVASSNWYLVENLQKLMFIRTAISSVINIGLNFLLIPKYGVIGAAVATVITQALGTLVYDNFRKDTKKLFYMKLASLNLIRIILVGARAFSK